MMQDLTNDIVDRDMFFINTLFLPQQGALRGAG
jgi:hypothetical protein